MRVDRNLAKFIRHKWPDIHVDIRKNIAEADYFDVEEVNGLTLADKYVRKVEGRGITSPKARRDARACAQCRRPSLLQRTRSLLFGLGALARRPPDWARLRADRLTGRVRVPETGQRFLEWHRNGASVDRWTGRICTHQLRRSRCDSWACPLRLRTSAAHLVQDAPPVPHHRAGAEAHQGEEADGRT